ncbi:MAG: SDR family NAD(P)-dependent oxidoreductase [Candidatus Omnitrophica bacterium]|nr:SDR family NAD(P)-dependent oxidoreductase [Candidatus Omnitrophota bacterium]
MEISGNTILITGGATGIGLAVAEAFVSRGNEVIVCGRRRHKLAAAKARLPQIHVHVCDLSKPPARRALVKWTLARFPHLNVLVNNAGVQRPVDFRKGVRDLQHADEELATNLAAPIHLSALLIPHLRRRKLAAIVNISSGLGFTPLAAVPVYSATKAAIHSLSLSIRRQLRDTTVRVFEIAPPIVATELAGGRRRPNEAEYTMTPGEVAAGIIDAIEHDRYEVPLGAAANLFNQRDALFAVING